MRSSLTRLAATLIVGLQVAACGSTTTSPSPSPSPRSSAAPSPAPSASSVLLPPGSGGPVPSATPLLPAGPASASLPVRGSAREYASRLVQMAPGPYGGLYVLIPARQAPATLVLLDSSGNPAPGWPVVVPRATSCDKLLPVADGSVRLICTLENPDGNMYDPIAAYAFDENARMRVGWPVQIQASSATGRVVGNDLALVTIVPLGDVIEEGQPSMESGLVTIGPDGTTSAGARVPIDFNCCISWAVGTDGIAYGTGSSDGSSAMVALDGTGIRPGWPITLDDAISEASIRADGRVAVVLGSLVRSESRVIVLDRDARISTTAQIPLQTALYSDDTGGCTVGSPQAPVVAEDGTVIVYSELNTSLYAVDSSPSVMPGWPIDSGTSLDRPRPGTESEHEAGYCPGPVPPAIALDSTLYLARENASGTVGGSLLAVGRDGRVVPGWPVELKRPGSEFWSVVVSPNGTAHALAFETEAGGRSSATILAIAADSDVIWTRTIIEP
jgi:hypothetical protein